MANTKAQATKLMAFFKLSREKADILVLHGLTSPRALRELNKSALMRMPGIGAATADKILARFA